MFTSTYIIKYRRGFEFVQCGISSKTAEQALYDYARREHQSQDFVFSCLEAVDIEHDFGDLSKAQAESVFEQFRLGRIFEGYSSDRVEVGGRSYVPFVGEFHHVYAVVDYYLSTLGAELEAIPTDDNFGLPDEDTLMIRDDLVVGVLEPTGEFTHL